MVMPYPNTLNSKIKSSDTNVLECARYTNPSLANTYTVDTDERILGVELEILLHTHEKPAFKLATNQLLATLPPGYAILKSDCSLHNATEAEETGVELVTLPAVLEEQKSKLSPVMDLIEENNEMYYAEDYAGMHVHVNKRSINNQTKHNLMHFVHYTKNKSKIIEVCGRYNSTYARLYSLEAELSPRHSWHCINGKFDFINETDSTLEIRGCMTPTTKYQLNYRLEFIDSLVAYCTAPPDAGYYRWSRYLMFLRDMTENQKYENIISCIKSSDLNYRGIL